MASGFYTSGLRKCLQLNPNIDTATVKLMLVKTTYTFDRTEDNLTNLATAELVATNYTGGFAGAGRKTVAVALTENDTNHRVDIELNAGSNLTWTALGGATNDTIGGVALVYETGASDANSVPLAFFDVTDTPTNGSDITLTITALASGGNLQITTSTNGWYTSGLRKCLDGTLNLDTDTVKLMLTDDVYSFAQTEDNLTALATNELNCTNYTGGFAGGGRKTVAVALTDNDTSHRVDIELNGGSDLTWTALGGAANDTIGGAALVYETGASDANSVPLCWFNLTDTGTNGSDVVLDIATLAAGGNIQISITSA